ncbi:MAG: hypothetical protein QM758_00685 [Armatimonas sp.]
MLWTIRLLGGAHVAFPGTDVSHFESSRVVALLARLALFPHRLHPREELIELLWPEVPPDTGRHRLRTALSSLRRQLEPPGYEGKLFSVTRHALQLVPGAFLCDVAQLEKAIQARRTDEALALMRGPLLPGLYDDWILLERERLEALCEALPEQPAPSLLPPAPLLPVLPGKVIPPILPTYLTSFVGREKDFQEVKAGVETYRLTTLTGPGGIGKTRLATEVARAVAVEFDRCALIPLADCMEASELEERVRAVLGLTEENGGFDTLLDQSVFLVLDNLEHLIDGEIASGVGQLLTSLPKLTCLATSRRRLGIMGEREYPLSPLMPSESGENPARALFLDRVRAVRPGFSLAARHEAEIQEIESALEGVPLAIELAAPRLRTVSLTELRQTLTTEFSAFARTGFGSRHGRRVHKDDRHRSLHAAIAWSWNLLSPRYQTFLSTLSVFRGGWTTEAAASGLQ